MTNYYPLTHPQMRIWNIELLYPKTAINNITAKYKFKTLLSPELLEQALNAVVEAHEGMRLRMVRSQLQVEQYVSEYRPFPLPRYTFDSLDQLEKWVSEKATIPFELNDSNLFEFAYLFAEGTSYLYVKQHHLTTDAWSLSLLFNTAMKYYEDFNNGLSAVQEKGHSYLSYLESEHNYKSSARFEKNRKFWMEHYAEIPEVCSVKEPLNEERGVAAENREYILSKNVTEEINVFCEENQINVFRLLTGILYIYLYRVTSNSRITIGMPLHNRTTPIEKQTMGTYISTAPFVLDMHEQMDLMELLQKITREQSEVIRNQRYPFELLIQDLRKTNPDLMDYDLFRVMLSYQNAKYDSEWLDDTQWVFNGTELYDLSIHISDRENSGLMKFEFHYSSNIFNAEDIEALIAQYFLLLQGAIQNPRSSISSLSMLSGEEEQRLLNLNTGTSFALPEGITAVQELFEKQVLQHPSHVAVRTATQTLTYSELNTQGNRIARSLRNLGVKGIVGLMISRSANMPAAIIGILKAGAAYLPIDPEFPADRISYMLEDSGAAVLLTERKFADFIGFSGEFILLEDLLEDCPDGGNVPLSNTINDLAYVIYTSGSTGKPKGVMIEHQAVLNFFNGMISRISFNDSKKILGLTTISFDIFVLEMLLPLTVGMEIVIAGEKEQVDPHLLSELISRHSVDMLQITPSRLQLILSQSDTKLCLQHLSEIMIGGEALPMHLLEALGKYTSAKIYNMYGPTETTVWSTVEEVTKARQITLGKPIINTQIYIVNQQGLLQPPGVAGELCISGLGLARGYMNNPDLTSSLFVPNPFYKGDKGSSARMYRTGDMARWKKDGSIEYIGRKNNQVKLRGYRIELEEIEAVMLGIPGITGCTVLIRQLPNGEQAMIAYYKADQKIAVQLIRERLIRTLPSYMMPTAFMQLDEFPMTPNGKMDRKSFPTPDFSKLSAHFPENESLSEHERNIIAIWKNLLCLEHIGLYSSFFELGGNSVLLVQMHEMLDRLYPGVTSVADVFANPSPFKLAQFIIMQNEKITSRIEPLTLQADYRVQEADKEAVNFQCDLSGYIKALQITSLSENHQIINILLSVFVYSLSLLSEHNQMCIPIFSEGEDTLSVLNADLCQISNFTELLYSIDSAYQQRKPVPIKKDEVMTRNGSKCSISGEFYPLFMTGARVDSFLIRGFDLIFHIKVCTVSELRVDVIYNPQSMSRETVELLIEHYISALEEIEAHNVVRDIASTNDLQTN
ncbi:amino acid adenylation domain-containing protein [Paenibacillus graminis]|uniref:non-ribosomal peptide synthetase n=1 Tax=Paenibacillus graminis TaxID=189425 RepID=UPI002DBE59C4|nr:amino acid adenylation domain-containing protein [Paenibacillus graminis]MEC0172767.1 amino acid adenylation domain-containing protein [Paenibacillus graminis]